MSNEKLVTQLFDELSWASNKKLSTLYRKSKAEISRVKNMRKVIEKFAGQNNTPLKWRDVKDYLMTKNGVLVDNNTSRRTLKEKLRYNY